VHVRVPAPQAFLRADQLPTVASSSELSRLSRSHPTLYLSTWTTASLLPTAADDATDLPATIARYRDQAASFRRMAAAGLQLVDGELAAQAAPHSAACASALHIGCTDPELAARHGAWEVARMQLGGQHYADYQPAAAGGQAVWELSGLGGLDEGEQHYWPLLPPSGQRYAQEHLRGGEAGGGAAAAQAAQELAAALLGAEPQAPSLRLYSTQEVEEYARQRGGYLALGWRLEHERLCQGAASLEQLAAELEAAAGQLQRLQDAGGWLAARVWPATGTLLGLEARVSSKGSAAALQVARVATKAVVAVQGRGQSQVFCCLDEPGMWAEVGSKRWVADGLDSFIC
jgi:hypothetical protein